MILRFTQYDIARALESTYKQSTGVDICIEAFDVVIDKITYCSGSSPLEIEISLDLTRVTCPRRRQKMDEVHSKIDLFSTPTVWAVMFLYFIAVILMVGVILDGRKKKRDNSAKDQQRDARGPKGGSKEVG